MARLINRAREDEMEFEVVALVSSDWDDELRGKLKARTKILVPEFFFSDVEMLERISGKESYDLEYFPVSQARGIGMVYLMPSAPAIQKPH
jgi:hypothetical protein